MKRYILLPFLLLAGLAAATAQTHADSLAASADSLKAYHTRRYADGITRTVETTIIGNSVASRKSWSILGLTATRDADGRLRYRPHMDNYISLIPSLQVGYASLAGDLDAKGAFSASITLPASVPVAEHFSIAFGIGFNFANYHLADGNLLHVEDGQTLYTPYDPGFDYRRPTLQTVQLHFPLMAQWEHLSRRGNHIAFGLGAQFGMNTAVRSSVINKDKGDSFWRRSYYTLDDQTHMDVRPYALGLLAGFEWNGLCLTASYTPTNLFKDKTGLDAHPFGISLGIDLFERHR